MVERHLGPDRPPGLLAHVAGPTEDGWRIINIWQDEAAFRRFQSERLVRAAGLAAQEDGFDPAKAAGFRSMTRRRRRDAVLMADAASLRSRNAAFWTGRRPAGSATPIGRTRSAGRWARSAMDRLAARPGERILDVGCGCGGTTAELAAAVGADRRGGRYRPRRGDGRPPPGAGSPRTGTRASGSTRPTSRPSMSCRGRRSTRRTREWP